MSFTDPIGTFLLPLVFLLGGFFVLPGARVHVDLGAIRRRLHRSLVYLAGPAANFAFLVALAIFHACQSDDAVVELRASIVLMAWLQASSVVINLLPVPSFDGFGAIEQWLPEAWRPDGLTRSIAGVTAIFLIFMIDPMAKAMIVLIYLVIAPFGFDLHDIRTGYSALAFWAR